MEVILVQVLVEEVVVLLVPDHLLVPEAMEALHLQVFLVH